MERMNYHYDALEKKNDELQTKLDRTQKMLVEATETGEQLKSQRDQYAERVDHMKKEVNCLKEMTNTTFNVINQNSSHRQSRTELNTNNQPSPNTRVGV